MGQKVTIKLITLVFVFGFVWLPSLPASAQNGTTSQLEVFFEDHHDVSPPLRHIQPALRDETPHAIPLRYPACSQEHLTEARPGATNINQFQYLDNWSY